MAIGHFILSLSSFAFFFTIMFSLLWSEGTKGSDLDGGSGMRGSKGLYRMERIIYDEVFAFYPINFHFFLFVGCVCLASQSVFSVRAGLGREDTFFFFSLFLFLFLFHYPPPPPPFFWGGLEDK